MVLGELGSLNPEQKRALEELRRNGEELLVKINDLLDLAKIEAGKMELFLEMINVEDIVSRVVRLVGPLVRKKSQTLEVKILTAETLVHADQTKLQQVLLNLVSNAVKYTPPEGTIHILIQKKQSVLEISVEDDGIGIPVGEQEKIFDFFHQTQNSYVRKQEGTGLGLALAKQFVELHGGKIWVQSRPGAGSRFTFHVPLKRA